MKSIPGRNRSKLKHPLFRRWLVAALYFLIALCSFGQSEKPVMIHVSYFGATATHPGLKVGLQHTLHRKDFEKFKRSGREVKKRKELLVTYHVGFFHHPRFNTTVFVNGEFGFRRVHKNGNKFEALLGIGALRTFLGADTYLVQDNGQVKRVRGAGQWGILPSLAIGFGKDLGFTKNKVWAYHLRPSVYFQIPYNHTFLPHFVLEAGVTYRLSKLLKHSV